jgi:3-ketosteroid 9alpha-monooxygenase subunit B
MTETTAATPATEGTAAPASTAVPVPRRKIRQFETMVYDVIVETPDTVTLVLFSGNEPCDYDAGQFITIDPHQFEDLGRFIAYFEDVKKRKEPVRAYSLCSEPSEKHIAFTVKEEQYVSGQTPYPPLLSPFLVRRVKKGTRMMVTGFTGPYTLPRDVDTRTDHIVHVCAGSGIVPNYSIIKWALRERPRLRHTLVYSNRTWGDTIFRNELTDLQQRHPEQLRVLHTLTREGPPGLPGVDARTGRVGAALLREAIPDVSNCLVYACGPALSPFEKKAAREKGVELSPRFLESTLLALSEIGVEKKKITYESYG